MIKNVITAMVTILTVIFLGGLGQEAQAVEAVTQTSTTVNYHKVENLVRIADNVIILFDSSETMGKPFDSSGMTKLQAAKKIITQRTALLPDAIPGLNMGVYTYSYVPPTANTISNLENSTYYKMQPFNKAKFQKALEQLPSKASGPTLMVNGIRRLGRLLEDLSGRTVVFMFTDGTHGDQGASESPLELARKLAQKHDVSFKLISTTDAASEVALMDSVATINESSRVYSFESVLNRPEVISGSVFVIEESYLVSTADREEIVGFKLDNILFNFDKSDIEMEFTDALKAVGDTLQKYPSSYIVLAGHTDSNGAEEYNLGLSHQRVEAVGAYLAEQFKIDSSRIEMFWYGEAAPVASNDTSEGRQENRRVVGFIHTVK